MKNKEVVSAVLGSAFFAVPYLGLSVALGPSLLIGCAAFGASELMLSGFKDKVTLKDTNKTLYDKIQFAKKENKEILGLISKVENEDTKKNLKEIHDTIDKILDEVSRNPKKEKTLNNFFEYYLPILVKITSRYDEIENTRLTSSDEAKFLTKANKMIKDTSRAFKMILSSLYEKDIIDADADMKVYSMMMKADGIVDDNLLKKGSDSSEE